MPRRAIAIEEEIIEEDEMKEENAQKSSKELTLEDLPGVGAATAEKLISSGFQNMMAIAVASPGELVEIAGVSELVARKMINFARDKMEMGFESGEDLLKKRAKVEKIKTSSEALNNLLGGGFETGAITEAFGEFGSGKCVSKDTKVFYLNSSHAHLQTIEAAYNKYKDIYGETAHEEGFVVPTPPVEVMGLTENGIANTKALYLYKERVNKLYSVQTKRGRTLKVTGPHKLLVFDDGMTWRPSAIIQKGDLIAYPKEINFIAESNLTQDDAYFLGMFCAEGSANPLSISTGSEKIVEWLKEYIIKTFGYEPTVREDMRRPNTVYEVLLRNSTRRIMEGLEHSNSATKFVPENVLSGDSTITSSFLAGYLDGDGSVEKHSLSATTKSKELCEGVSYLLAKIGISSTVRQRQVKGNTFYSITVVGEDRTLLESLPSKIKDMHYTSRNSSYGFSGRIVNYLQEVYRDTLGGNRGRTAKLIGKASNSETFYHYLTRSAYAKKAINTSTMEKILLAFVNGLQRLRRCSELVAKLDETFSQEDFKALFDILPCAYNSLAKDIGISKAGIRNYTQRGVPKNRRAALLAALKKEVDSRIIRLEDSLKVLKNVTQLNWDEVVEVKEMPYEDYVYDFVVPEGHSFVGGEMPTILHNTQIAHSLCVDIQKMDPSYVAVFIDTENTFRPERIIQLAEGAKLEAEPILKNIKVARAYNSDHQMLLAEKVEDLITKRGLKVKVLIVDSLTAHFRAEFIGRGTLAERQQKLNKHMHALMRLADMYNLCVFVTNQVMARPDVFFGDPTQAIGGHIVAHASTFRIYLRKGKKGTRVAKLVDSPNLAEGEAIFMVETGGLKDVNLK